MPKFSDLFVALGLQDQGFKKGLDKNKQRLNAFTKSIKSLGVTIAAAFSVNAIVGFVKQSVLAYDQEAKAHAKLLQALGGRKALQQDLIKQASELQRETLFGDEVTVEAQSRLAMLGLESSAIKRLIPLVQDLAQAKGMDLVTAADLVAKSVGSSTNAMSRYGIQIEGAVGSSERLESAITSLNEQVGGQAKVAAETGLGPLVQLSNAWSDFGEILGGMVAPALTKVAKGLTGVMENINMLSTAKSLSFWDKVKLTMFPTSTSVIADIAVKMVKDQNLEQQKLNLELERQQELQEKILKQQQELQEKILKQQAEQYQKLKSAREESEKTQVPLTGMTALGFDKSFRRREPMAEPKDTVAQLNLLNSTIDETITLSQEMSALVTSQISTMAETIGESLGQMFSGDGGAKDFFEGILNVAMSFMKQFGQVLIALGTTMIITTAGLSGWGMLAGGLALIAASEAIPGLMGFADGGLVFGPTMGLIGEGAGTSRSNPEIVAPLDRLTDIIGAGNGGTLTATVTGEQIQFALNRMNKRRGQVR